MSEATEMTNSFQLKEGLLLDGAGSYGRSPVHTDIVEEAIITGTCINGGVKLSHLAEQKCTT
jgi:hypothetical protein